MGFNRYAKRPDSTQESIVKGLRDAHVQVWIIGRPCDLLCYYWHRGRREYRWQTLECKSPHGKDGRAAIDPRQAEQIEFIQQTGTPIVLNSAQALAALESV